jgi:hypothetical protein
MLQALMSLLKDRSARFLGSCQNVTEVSKRQYGGWDSRPEDRLKTFPAAQAQINNQWGEVADLWAAVQDLEKRFKEIMMLTTHLQDDATFMSLAKILMKDLADVRRAFGEFQMKEPEWRKFESQAIDELGADYKRAAFFAGLERLTNDPLGFAAQLEEGQRRGLVKDGSRLAARIREALDPDSLRTYDVKWWEVCLNDALAALDGEVQETAALAVALLMRQIKEQLEG